MWNHSVTTGMSPSDGVVISFKRYRVWLVQHFVGGIRPHPTHAGILSPMFVQLHTGSTFAFDQFVKWVAKTSDQIFTGLTRVALNHHHHHHHHDNFSGHPPTRTAVETRMNSMETKYPARVPTRVKLHWALLPHPTPSEWNWQTEVTRDSRKSDASGTFWHKVLEFLNFGSHRSPKLRTDDPKVWV